MTVRHLLRIKIRIWFSDTAGKLPGKKLVFIFTSNFPYLKENLPFVQIAPVNIFAESAKAVFDIARHINLPFLLRTTDLESDIHLDHL